MKESWKQLRRIRHVVMDLDGTVYQGKTLFPTTLPFLQLLRELGIGFTFLTNNSSFSAQEYHAMLNQMGIVVSSQQIVTSTDSVVGYLLHHAPDVKKLFILATDAVRSEIAAHGWVDVAMDEEPDAVVVAFDRSLTYERLCKAAYWIRRGKLFLGTHPDLECPTDAATLLIDCGGICASLSAVTGREARTLGKPHREVLDAILEQHQLAPDEAVMCGDRINTDIQLALNAQVPSVLIASDAETLRNSPATWNLPNLGCLGELLKEARASE